MNRIKNILKTNKIIYYLYNHIISALIRFIGLFIRTDNKLILFNSFGGKRFDDSPKAIYDYMLTSRKYKDYKLIWALDDPSKFNIKKQHVVKNSTLGFFITALKAKY